MEGEMKNMVMVWSTVIVSLLYCHTIAKFIDKGTPRLFCILPIITVFFFLPLNLTTVHFTGLTAFFITWLSNFKLVLFSYGKGPLSSNPPLSLSQFIPMACLPIKPVQNTTLTRRKSPVNYFLKLLFLGLLFEIYNYNIYIHRYLRLLLYILTIYVFLEILLALLGGVTKAVVGVELEQQFDEPYLSTSLQEFWGKRWNVVVCNILHPAVYNPVRSFSSRVLNRKWGPLLGVLASFLVSGVMHEFILFSMGRMRPTWHITVFFLIHGVALALEIYLKKVVFVTVRVRVPVVVKWGLTLGFLLGTTFLLFLPSLLRIEVGLTACREVVAFVDFVMHHRLISPSNVSCPFRF